jgi:type I restriction enzyme S subunit
MKRLIVVRPPESVLLKWNALVEPLVARSFSLERESIVLAATRDALLPKLLSGEMRVQDRGD